MYNYLWSFCNDSKWNKLCAIIDHIRNCIVQFENLNSARVGDLYGEIVVQEDYYSETNEIVIFFTYAYILISAINNLFELFGYTKHQEYKKAKNSFAIFNEETYDTQNTKSDEGYFLYLRKLIVGHPTSVDKYDMHKPAKDTQVSPHIQRQNIKDSKVLTVARYSETLKHGKINVKKEKLIDFIKFKYQMLDIFRMIYKKEI
ncbi:hypothetical protein [Acholeplasma palmae]|nr:hypothetical protein [Alteracholeplasma palmae]